MKIFALLFSLNAFASTPELPAAGTYSYKGSFEVMQKRVAEAVNVAHQKGRERMDELKAQGFACVYAAQEIYRCVAFVSVAGSEAEVKEEIERVYANASLFLKTPTGEPKKSIDGETYEEWYAPQAGSFLGQEFSDYRFQILKGEEITRKILFGADGLILEGNAFRHIRDIGRQINRQTIVSYLVGIRFEK